MVTECNDGLLIADLTDLEHITSRSVRDYVASDSTVHQVTRAHTLFIDEKGYLYFAGANSDHSGFVILDLNDHPEDPVWINAYDEEYYHEVFVMRDTLYGASIYFGEFVAWDLRDRLHPVRMASQPTAFRFTHSVWREPARPVLYTADEKSSAIVESWNISDPFRARRLDGWRTNNADDPESIPHNVFFRDSFLFVSWYTEGVRVLDVRDPANITETAWYDTHPQKQGGFHGVWNVYPYFRSGILLASDIENGMFVLQFHPSRAALLQGVVRDRRTGLPVANAAIEISDGQKTVSDRTNASGYFSSGFHRGGNLQLKITAPAYEPLTTGVMLREDSTVKIQLDMVPLQKYRCALSIRHKLGQQAESGVKVKLWNENFEYSALSATDGAVVLDQVVEGEYRLQLARWGRLHYSDARVTVSGDHNWQVQMEDGYEDQFNIAEDWIDEPDTLALRWQLGDFSELTPPPSNYPSSDDASDLGNAALYTNNFSDEFPERNVAGHYRLLSPEMDLTPYGEIDLSYVVWAYGGWDSAIRECYLQFDQERIPLEQIYENLSGKFNRRSAFRLDVHDKERAHVRFVIHLWNDPDSIRYAISMKAALDAFLLTGRLLSQDGVTDPDDDINVYPVPAKDHLVLENMCPVVRRIRLMDAQGIVFYSGLTGPRQKTEIGTAALPEGLYFIIALPDEGGKAVVKRFLKINSEN